MLLADFFSELSGSLSSVTEFVGDGGVFMYCLLGLSLLSVSVIVYKALSLRAEKVVPDSSQQALGQVREYLASGESASLAEVLQENPSPLSRLGLQAMSDDHQDRDAAERATETHAREEVVELEKGVALLEVVITIAPLLGLLGTVSGLVVVFGNLSAAGSAGEHAKVARGIAEALSTTIAGLAVAVPTVIAHSYFTKKLERMAVRMEVLTGGVIAARHRGAAQTIVPAPDPVAQVYVAPEAVAPEPKALS